MKQSYLFIGILYIYQDSIVFIWNVPFCVSIYLKFKI